MDKNDDNALLIFQDGESAGIKRSEFTMGVFQL